MKELTLKYKKDLKKALRAVAAGKAYHWPTIADILDKEIERLNAENSSLRRESEFGKKLALHIRNLPTAKLDSEAFELAHKVLNADAKAAPCIECGETGNHNPLCMSGNRLDGTREDWASKVGE